VTEVTGSTCSTRRWLNTSSSTAGRTTPAGGPDVRDGLPNTQAPNARWSRGEPDAEGVVSGTADQPIPQEVEPTRISPLERTHQSRTVTRVENSPPGKYGRLCTATRHGHRSFVTDGRSSSNSKMRNEQKVQG
jgi:hypothetical protein